MKIPTYVIIVIIIAVGVTIGNATALVVHNEDTRITGELVVDGGTVTSQRTGTTSAIVVQNDGTFENAIKFNHFKSGEEQIFQIRQVPAGSRLEIVDISNNKVGVAILASSGNIGIGTQNPVEQLDVAGNIHLTGNIVSPNDICIGNCP